MKSNIRKVKHNHAAGAATLATQIALSLAMISLCYAATPVFADAGSSLLASACDFMQGDNDVQQAVNAGQVSLERACQQSGAGIARQSSTLIIAGNPARLRVVHMQDTAAAAADLATTVSLSTPDRHWCAAEAFNAALDHKKLDYPARQQAPMIVLK